MERLEQRTLLAVGDLLIADPDSDSILRFDGGTGEPRGTFVPSGTAGLADPHAPTVGPDGDLYVVSLATGQEKILRFDGSTGSFEQTIVDTGTSGFAGASALRFGPEGHLYAATNSGLGVLKFSTDGTPLGSVGTAAGIRRAAGIAFGPDGMLYVLDSDGKRNTFDDRILRFNPSSGELLNVAVAPGILDDAADFTFGPDGLLYVPDITAENVLVFSLETGDYELSLVSDGALRDGVAFSVSFGPDGHLFASVPGGVLRFDGETRRFVDEFVATHSSYLAFQSPAGLNTNLVVTDVQTSSGALAGGPLTVQYTVGNQSAQAADAATWTDVVYLSRDERYDPGDIEIARHVRTGPLTGGGEYQQSLAAALPELEGNFHVLVFADRRGQVSDVLRNDNVRATTHLVSLASPICSVHDPQQSLALGRRLLRDPSDQNLVFLDYTVYNLQGCSVSGTVLTTELTEQATVQAATPAANQNLRQLVWSLGTLEPYGSATVRVQLQVEQPNASLDTGSQVVGLLDATPVSDTLPPVQLRNVPADPELLTATSEFDPSDPELLTAAAVLDHDPERIFAFVRDAIAYESYEGSLRGARGTLWNRAGNSLDQASLLVGLLRASGIPARYATGTLADEQARALIASMFPAVEQLNGYVPDGADISEPTADPQLLAETRDHWWVEWEQQEDQFIAADPSFSGGTLGETWTEPGDRFASVPENQRHRITVRLRRELAIPAYAILGGSPLSEAEVLSATFDSASLAGRPLTIGHLVAQRSVSNQIARATTNTYTPYFAWGDYASGVELGDPQFGRDFQEIITSVPLGSQVLTGLFLDVERIDPQGETERLERSLLDRIGPNVRQFGGVPNLLFSPDDPPPLSDFQVFALHLNAGQVDPVAGFRLQAAIAAIPERMASTTDLAELAVAEREMLEATAWLNGHLFQSASDLGTTAVASEALVTAYLDRPRVVVTSAEATDASLSSNFAVSLDLRDHQIRAIPYPGQARTAAAKFQTLRGLQDSVLETEVLRWAGSGQAFIASALSTAAVFQAAAEQGIELAGIDRGNLHELDNLDLSRLAKNRITSAVESDRVVVVPQTGVMLDDGPALAWYELDPATGYVVGVLEDGTHGSLVKMAAKYAMKFVPKGPGYDSLVQVKSVRSRMDAFTAAQSVNLSYQTCMVSKGLFARWVVNATGGQNLDRSSCKAFMWHVSDQLIKQVKQRIRDFEYTHQFQLAFNEYRSKKIQKDPPVPQQWTGVADRWAAPDGTETATVQSEPTRPSGQVSAEASTTYLAVSGSLEITWSADQPAGFDFHTLESLQAEVFDAQGNLIGAGLVSDSATEPRLAMVSGTGLQFHLVGDGSVTVFGDPDGGTIGTDWQAFELAIDGDMELRFASSTLAIDGNPLPSGTYRIRTTAAALKGQGTTAALPSAPQFGISSQQAVVQLGPADGEVEVGGQPLPAAGGLTFEAFQGELELSPDATGQGGKLAIVMTGEAQDVLRVVAPASLQTGRFSPLTYELQLDTSLAGPFRTVVEHRDWQVTVGSDQRFVLSPLPGIPAGDYVVQVTVQSQSHPELVASAEFTVTLVDGAADLELELVADPFYYVDVFGAQIPTVYEATVRNLGADSDTFTFAFPQVPDGWKLHSSLTKAMIPAGGSAVFSVILEPDGSIAPPGTESFLEVQATSTRDPLLQRSLVLPFTAPAVPGLTVLSQPVEISVSPGGSADVTLLLIGTGNVTQSVQLTAETSPGLVVQGLTTLSLDPGEQATVVFNLTASTSAALNTIQYAEVLADLGTPDPWRLLIPVLVVAPGVESMSGAATTSRQMGQDELANRLEDLARAIGHLAQDADSRVYLEQAMANLDAVLRLWAADALLRHFVERFTPLRNQLESAADGDEIRDVLDDMTGFWDQFAAELEALRDHDFQLWLLPNTSVAEPLSTARFPIQLRNIGRSVTTYVLSVGQLPDGVTAEFPSEQVTLQPGESAQDLVLNVSQVADQELLAFEFEVIASVEDHPELARSVDAALTARREFVSVVSVNADPPFADPGKTVHVWTRVLNAVNRVQDARLSFDLLAPDGSNVYSSPAVTVQLNVRATSSDIYLGAINTSALALGEYTLAARITDLDSQPLPGGTGTGRVRIGSPVTASVRVTPELLPAGDRVVDSVLRLDATPFFPSPLTLLSQEPVAHAQGLAIAGSLAYVCGSAGIQVVDIANDADPQPLGIHGEAASACAAQDGSLATVQGSDAPVKLTVYDLAEPTMPATSGQVLLDYARPADVVLLDQRAYIPMNSYCFTRSSIFAPFDVRQQQGDLLAVDFSDPANPSLAQVLVDTFGTASDGDDGEFCPYSGGEHPIFNVTVRNDQTLYVSTTTTAGEDPTSGVGRLLVLDIDDAQELSVVGQLDIPEMVNLFAVAFDGDRGLAVGSSGGFPDQFRNVATEFAPRGSIVLAELDLTDPRNPTVLRTTDLGKSPRGVSAPLPLGNGRYLVDRLGLTDESPELLLIDASDSEEFVVTPVRLPAEVMDMAVVGNRLYTVGPAGLLIYEIGQPPVVPLTAEVRIPRGSGVQVVDGSFSLPPDRTLTADYESLVFTVPLTGAASQEITWRTEVSGLKAGERRPVTAETRIDFVVEETPGTITVPPASVMGRQLLALQPDTRTARPGGLATYVLDVYNPGTVPAEFQLDVLGIPPEWVQLPDSVTVQPGAVAGVSLWLRPDAFAIPETYGFTVTASGPEYGEVAGRVRVQGDPILPVPDPAAHGVAVTLLSEPIVAGPETAAEVRIRVTNVGTEADRFELDFEFEAGFVDFVPSFELSPGTANSRELSIQVTPDHGADPGTYPLRVTAAASGRQDVFSQDETTVQVLPVSVDVDIWESFEVPGQYELMVFNAGPQAEVFDLHLAGPLATAATLAIDSVELGPLESAIVPLTIEDLPRRLPGEYQLIATARARSQADIQDSAGIAIQVAAARRVAASFLPEQQFISEPGQTFFTLIVDNPSNLGDEFTATIRDVTGSTTARWETTEDQPNPTSQAFRLPAFSNGQLRLHADVRELEVSVITVDIQSVTDPSVSTVARATVSSCQWYNFRNQFDVNGDGEITPLDALLVVNRLNTGDSANLPPAGLGMQPPPYVDVNCDNFATPSDAILVVNRLNNAAGEGESPVNPERLTRFARPTPTSSPGSDDPILWLPAGDPTRTTEPDRFRLEARQTSHAAVKASHATGSDAGADQVLQAGLDEVSALPAWLTGWSDAAMGVQRGRDELPLEDLHEFEQSVDEILEDIAADIAEAQLGR